MARISKYRSDAGAQLGRVQYPIGTKGVPTERKPLWNESPNVKHREPLFGQRKDGAKMTASKLYPKVEVDHHARQSMSPLGTGQAKRVMSQAEKEDAQRWNERARKLRRG